MSSNISLSNLLTVNGVSPTTPTHQDAASHEFSGAMNAATGGRSSSLPPNIAVPQSPEMLPGNTPEARMLAEQSNAAVDIVNLSRPEQYTLVLESLVQNPELLPKTTQQVTTDYSLNELDTLSLERGFLMFIQLIQDQEIERARLALKQLLRKRSRFNHSAETPEEAATNGAMHKVLTEIDSALVANDLHAAQLSINSFLARLGDTQGAFLNTTA